MSEAKTTIQEGVILCTSREQFAKIIEYFTSLGVDRSKFWDAHIGFYYGLFKGKIDCFPKSFVESNNIPILTVPAKIADLEVIKLKTGKWYKYQNMPASWWLGLILDEQNFYCGFNEGLWFMSKSALEPLYTPDYIEATSEEVKDLLDKEVQKRYKRGCMLKTINGIECILKKYTTYFDFENNILFLRDNSQKLELFNNGKWADVLNDSALNYPSTPKESYKNPVLELQEINFEGIDMEVSNCGVNWRRRTVLAKLKNKYLAFNTQHDALFIWNKAQPIQQKVKVTKEQIAEAFNTTVDNLIIEE